ncbi:MAG: hypothetical protein GYB68_05105 [Chloroflexi bacterium]|nr:hypothetical protein [Chloroflexota bacterium]
MSVTDNPLPSPIEISAPTVEDAIQAGLENLGLSRTEVIIEVVSEERPSMYGMESQDAVVRLTPIAMPRNAAGASVILENRGTENEGEVSIAQEVLQELLKRMKIDATVYARRSDLIATDEDNGEIPWILDVQGVGLDELIGRNGETLADLQLITRLIVSRQLERRSNVVIDVEGYKTKREDSLRRLAKHMAAQARQTGRKTTLEPMPPNERRIIHITLRDDDTVSTESVGSGKNRKVQIIPRRD